jgi:hypothetical protein
MASRDSKRRRSDDDDEDSAPRKKKAKKQAGGVSMGLVIGLCAGGGALVLLSAVCIVVAIFWSRGSDKGGPGFGGGLARSPGRTKTVTLEAKGQYFDQIGLEENRRHQMTVESDAAVEIEIVILAEGLGGKRDRIASNKVRGKTCTVSFQSPGFGDTPFYVMNHGPGPATFTITHDGLKNPNWR